MPRQKVDKQHIIKQALNLFRQKSYFNTSMADIATACGLLKGSLYHYFDSKESLMREVVRSVHEYFIAKVFHFAYDHSVSPKTRMENFFKAANHIFVDEESGDMLGNIGVETAILIPEFAEDIRLFFSDFFQAIQTIYLDKYGPEIAMELAERCVAEIEGSIMLSRLFNDKSYLQNTTNRIILRLD
ncbi:MAG: TetR/AcrR family transcriptional regulator [Saprospiraceae bacterium]